jgi:type II secretory pathway pseudopilin PulG
MRRAEGFSLPELLLAALLLGGLAMVGLGEAARCVARQRVESAARRVALGLELGRAAAQRQGAPCGLQLSERGWQGPESGGSLPACTGVQLALGEGVAGGAVQLEHNLPPEVRFTSNGLVLDGGTVRLSAEGSDLERCLVMALPLGVVRLGRWEQQGCRPDPSL